MPLWTDLALYKTWQSGACLLISTWAHERFFE